MIFRIAAASFFFVLLVSSVRSADPAPSAISATDLAARLSAWQQDGASYARLRMEVKQPPGTTKSALQIQIKARRSKMATDVVYQILWPKERKGEAVLLRKASNRSASGSMFVPPDTLRPLDASQMKEPLFGSDISYEDLIDNFFAWEHQAIVGTEDVDGVSCQILESKPGKGDRSEAAEEHLRGGRCCAEEEGGDKAPERRCAVHDVLSTVGVTRSRRTPPSRTRRVRPRRGSRSTAS